MRYHILFKTTRFNLSEVKPDFINDCCFGEDAACWLRERLAEAAIPATEPDQEDWGWHMEADWKGESYFIGISGKPEAGKYENNQGEWRIIVQKDRSLLDKLTGRNRMSLDEGMLVIIRHLIEQQPDFNNVQLMHPAEQVSAA